MPARNSLTDKLLVSILTLLLLNIVGLSLISWNKVFNIQPTKQEKNTTKDIGHFMDKTPYEKEYKHTYTNKRNRVK